MSNWYKEYIKSFKQDRGSFKTPATVFELTTIVLLLVGFILLTASAGYYDAVFSNKY